jgi:hypothetical protein
MMATKRSVAPIAMSATTPSLRTDFCNTIVVVGWDAVDVDDASEAAEAGTSAASARRMAPA